LGLRCKAKNETRPTKSQHMGNLAFFSTFFFLGYFFSFFFSFLSKEIFFFQTTNKEPITTESLPHNQQPFPPQCFAHEPLAFSGHRVEA